MRLSAAQSWRWRSERKRLIKPGTVLEVGARHMRPRERVDSLDLAHSRSVLDRLSKCFAVTTLEQVVAADLHREAEAGGGRCLQHVNGPGQLGSLRPRICRTRPRQSSSGRSKLRSRGDCDAALLV